MPDGTLMVPNGWSPEHGPREDGVMHDQQLVWDLFQNYLEVAKALNVDMEYQRKVTDMLARALPIKWAENPAVSLPAPTSGYPFWKRPRLTFD
jgi:hypothetical protein